MLGFRTTASGVSASRPVPGLNTIDPRRPLSIGHLASFAELVETASPSPEDLCWAERTVWRVIPELDPRDKKVLLRMIAQEAGAG